MKKKIALVALVVLPLLFVVISKSAGVGQTPRPDFAITCDRDTLVSQPGQTVQFDLFLTPLNGFRGTVEVGCASSTSHINCQAPKQTFKLGPSLVVPVTLTVGSATEAGYGNYPIVVNAKGTYGDNLRTGTISHNEMLHLALVPKMP